MFNILALIVTLAGSFILTSLALPLLLQVALERFWPRRSNPNEFVVRGTHREPPSSMRSRPRALVA